MKKLGRVIGVILLLANLLISGNAAPETYRILPGAGQKVRFEARTNTEKYAGTTDQISGEVRVDPDQISVAPLAFFTVRPATFETGNGSRDSNMRRNHLKVDLFPTASFVLTSLDIPKNGPPPTLEIGMPVSGTLHGTLTIHGVSKSIAPQVTVTRERDSGSARDSLHITTRFVIRLEDYKIPTPRFLFLVTRQEHTILVDVHAVLANANTTGTAR